MVLDLDSTGLEASDRTGRMDKAGSRVCLEWAREVQASVIKVTFLPCCLSGDTGSGSARFSESRARALRQPRGSF